MPECALAAFFAEGHAEASVAEAVFDHISWEAFPEAADVFAEASPATAIALYPNPASDYVNIFLPQTSEQQVLCRLLSADGQVIVQQVFKTDENPIARLHWQQLPGGLYYVQVLPDEYGRRCLLPLVVK